MVTECQRYPLQRGALGNNQVSQTSDQKQISGKRRKDGKADERPLWDVLPNPQDHDHGWHISDCVAEKERDRTQNHDTIGQKIMRCEGTYGIFWKSRSRKRIVHYEQRRKQDEQWQIDLVQQLSCRKYATQNEASGDQ